MKPGDLCKFRMWTGVIGAIYANESDPSDRLAKVIFVKHQPNAFEYVPLGELEPATPEEVKKEKAARRKALELSMRRVSTRGRKGGVKP